MSASMERIGRQISRLRKARGLTQSELGGRLGVTFQAVSKWERGETLPDALLLMELADALDTTADNILSGGERVLSFRRELRAADAAEAVGCLARVGLLLGRQNILYRYAVEGLSEKMNTDIEAMLADEYTKECLAAEAVIHNIMAGFRYDMAEVRAAFRHEKWIGVIAEYLEKAVRPGAECS